MNSTIFYAQKDGPECQACGETPEAGETLILFPLGPGADPDSRKRCAEHRPYNAVAVLCHTQCIDPRFLPTEEPNTQDRPHVSFDSDRPGGTGQIDGDQISEINGLPAPSITKERGKKISELNGAVKELPKTAEQMPGQQSLTDALKDLPK